MVLLSHECSVHHHTVFCCEKRKKKRRNFHSLAAVLKCSPDPSRFINFFGNGKNVRITTTSHEVFLLVLLGEEDVFLSFLRASLKW
jgi:hypothetical protein